MSEAEKHTREMYAGLVAKWSHQEIIDHILYWRSKSDELLAEVEANKMVQHLRRRIHALTRKLKATREAAIEFMRGRAFDRLVWEKEHQSKDQP